MFQHAQVEPQLDSATQLVQRALTQTADVQMACAAQ